MMEESDFLNIILTPFRVVSHTILFVPSFIIWLLLVPFLVGFIIFFYFKKEIGRFNWKGIFFPFTCWHYGVFKQDNDDFFVFNRWDF